MPPQPEGFWIKSCPRASKTALGPPKLPKGRILSRIPRARVAFSAKKPQKYFSLSWVLETGRNWTVFVWEEIIYLGHPWELVQRKLCGLFATQENIYRRNTKNFISQTVIWYGRYLIFQMRKYPLWNLVGKSASDICPPVSNNLRLKR